MRKLITMLLLAATALPVATVPAAAQSNRELRRDRQEIREEQRELRDARRYGTRRDVREERRDVRDARREYREDLRDRNFGRDDWRRYRSTNRGLYARGRFAAPFRYNSFRPGLAIGRTYYAPRFIINDPWRYRLPRAVGYQRWVRHYDDALLVDTRRGRVIQVIRGFYW